MKTDKSWKRRIRYVIFTDNDNSKMEGLVASPFYPHNFGVKGRPDFRWNPPLRHYQVVGSWNSECSYGSSCRSPEAKRKSYTRYAKNMGLWPLLAAIGAICYGNIKLKAWSAGWRVWIFESRIALSIKGGCLTVIQRGKINYDYSTLRCLKKLGFFLF